MKFRFVSYTERHTGLTLEEAHAKLREFAQRYGLLVHIHPGGWEGNALSSAYPVGGDMMLDTYAVVRKGDL
jgi:hypothetical protein